MAEVSGENKCRYLINSRFVALPARFVLKPTFPITALPDLGTHESDLAQHSERNGDLSPSVARPARISPVTRERYVQIGITAQFLIVVRTLGEFFRLRHVLGTSFSAAVAAPFVGGALIAACFCWAGVTLYFFRRYTLSVWIALAAVVILLVYKIAVIGWGWRLALTIRGEPAAPGY